MNPTNLYGLLGCKPGSASSAWVSSGDVGWRVFYAEPAGGGNHILVTEATARIVGFRNGKEQSNG